MPLIYYILIAVALLIVGYFVLRLLKDIFNRPEPTPESIEYPEAPIGTMAAGTLDGYVVVADKPEEVYASETQTATLQGITLQDITVTHTETTEVVDVAPTPIKETLADTTPIATHEPKKPVTMTDYPPEPKPAAKPRKKKVVNTVFPGAKAHRNPLDDSERNEIKRLLSKGNTVSEVAEHYDVSRGTIRAVRDHWNITDC
jgi:DNA-binding NarL/FixJ family response regulator